VEFFLFFKIYINSQSKLAEAVSRLQTARDQSLRAEQLAIRSEVRASIEAWQKIFSTHFPAYG
jgi:hypothetical protein